MIDLPHFEFENFQISKLGKKNNTTMHLDFKFQLVDVDDTIHFEL